MITHQRSFASAQDDKKRIRMTKRKDQDDKNKRIRMTKRKDQDDKKRLRMTKWRFRTVKKKL